MDEIQSPEPTPLSANRLRAAFARMLGKPTEAAGDASEAGVVAQGEKPRDDTAVSPEAIVEAFLFVGRPDEQSIAPAAIAEAIRDVSIEEVEGIVASLNLSYERSESAFRIETHADGYRLTLADGLERVEDRLRGRVRPTQLSTAALETLAVVAYRQPIAEATVQELCGSTSVTALRQLVRLGLVRAEEPAEATARPHFATTDRFLRTLGLSGVDQLPRVAELDD